MKRILIGLFVFLASFCHAQTLIPYTQITPTPAADSAVVHNTGNETIAGTKTFSTQPVLPNAATLATTQVTTSGTSKDFLSIPSLVKRITVVMNGVSTTGTSNVQVQIGTGGTPTATGYTSTSATLASGGNTIGTSTTGCVIQAASASAAHYGLMTFVTLGSNVWVSSHADGPLSSNASVGGCGVTLGGTLDNVRLTTVGGTDTFDAGSVTILYE